MKNKLLSEQLVRLTDRLSDLEIHHGEGLGELLGISRAAVWKHIQRLSELGIAIDSIRGQGYRLTEPLQLISGNSILGNIGSSDFLDEKQIEVYEVLDSTNRRALDKSTSGTVQLVVAEKQERGRGRFDREWHSPFGQNIYLTLGLPFHGNTALLSGLSLVVGMAIHRAISDQLKELGINAKPEELSLKWPNDIYWNGAKLGGILIEAKAEMNSAMYLAIGIGLNVNMASVPENLDLGDWNSLRRTCGLVFNRNELIGKIVNQLHEELMRFFRDGFEPFLPMWNEIDYLASKNVDVQMPNEIVSGICRGVNQDGLLLIETSDSGLRTVSAGDATLKKSLSLY